MPRRSPRSPPKGAPRAANETSERILVAALEIFSEQGFDGTTTRAIAARAGVNLGLLKYYFGTKNDLWKASVERVFVSMAEDLGATVSATERHRAGSAELLRAAVRFAGRNPAFLRLMNDECKRDNPRMRWLVDRYSKRLYENVVSAFALERQGARFAGIAPEHLYYMFIGAVGMMFSQAPECRRLTGKDPTKDPAAIEAHAEAVVRLFLGK
jgi:TetR/AcrR family transcriptional regulator